MKRQLASLVKRLDDKSLASAGAIPWGSPVPAFGNLLTAKVATVGINPSNREFVDEAGNELVGRLRRFHTLRSLQLNRWSEANENHIRQIDNSCVEYFQRNPYDRWFRRLDAIIVGTSTSYYHPLAHACHLDLVPYATYSKWGTLPASSRQILLDASTDTLAQLLKLSSVKVLILNGGSVVQAFRNASEFDLQSTEMSSWSLPRQSSRNVTGYAYHGVLSVFHGVKLGREILVLGFNHNLQSSFGVSNLALSAIANWIGNMSEKAIR